LLTAHTQTELLLDAVKLKLVNYLVKPVNFKDLYESFKNASDEILRSKYQIIKFEDDITYDIKMKLLLNGTKEIHLTAGEHKLLDIFTNSRNQTVTIEEIKEQLWEDPFDATESAFKLVLSKLRTKIGKSSIRNVSGMGYFLVATWENK
jgi:DNA-binding response OmpR family regulator